MTTQEFSDQFDVLWNNISSNQAPGLNEYEKSVVLTKAQSQLVKEFFNARIDGVGGGFDGSQKRQYDFSSLIKTESLLNITAYGDSEAPSWKIDKRSEVFVFPQDYFLTVNEILADSRWQYSVLPIDYAEYQRLMLKPYNYPVKRGAWRLITNRLTYTCSLTLGSQVVDHIDEHENLPYCENNTLYFEYKDSLFKLDCSQAGFEDSYYKINLLLSVEDEALLENDAQIIKIIKAGFKELSKLMYIYTVDNNLTKACKYTSGFAGITGDAASTDYLYKTTTSTVSVHQLPVVEIIGKFKGDLLYRLRYVRKLKPIILDDLTNYGDLTIEGITETTECELPEECHEEILERAVTLAKIAWAGGTSTQAQAASSRKDND